MTQASRPLHLPVGFYLWYKTHNEHANCRCAMASDGRPRLTLLPAFATLPLMLQLGVSFTDAYSETMSGLTTTGSTILSNIDSLPESINLWRHLFVCLAWADRAGHRRAASARHRRPRHVQAAETPGPMKDSKMTPCIAQTAKGCGPFISASRFACVFAYRWAVWLV